ncbi:amidohydrolase [Pokkaliibacter plantistimulans]|uniref:Amidohydrolase n=1 Tax=Proteobacteria bacterium 228 TaxID=2083153 RepID=A0A2S5KKF3_9PROT|nr:M20 aminoacylase family protein [Pokkaliibacter plantistimulans]PPC75202.1 amidohydrolase [Pokkaliibacter plantistimulans]
MSSLIPLNSSLHQQMKAWRHTLHSHPETAYEEVRTSAMVAGILRDLGLAVEVGLGGTGVVATLQGRLGAGEAIALRADMDALDVEEMNQFAHCSTVKGKMHACGHDGHTTMLLGAAAHLAANPDFYGTLHFIFQPAEENEAGAKAMIDDGLFERFPVSAVYGMHNWPALPAGQAAVHAGPVMAAFDTFEIEVKGHGCHGAMPHMGVDPIQVAAQLVTALQSIVSRNVDPQKSAVISVTKIESGHTFNVIPESCHMLGTTRSFDPAVRDLLEQRMGEMVTQLCAALGCTGTLKYTRRYPATINTAADAELCRAVLSEQQGIEQVHWNAPASMGAEDFAFMLERVPGCYIWMGNGSSNHSHGLHSPHYDFNDDILPLGASFWAGLVYRRLGQA